MAGQIRMRDAGNVLRLIKKIRMRDAGNVLRTIKKVRMRDAGNVLRTVWTYFSVDLDDYDSETVDSSTASSADVFSPTITGTVSGGTAPYTYLWSKLSGDAITITSPTAAATTFHRVCFNGAPREAFFSLQVTDSLGEVTGSGLVRIYLEHIDSDAP